MISIADMIRLFTNIVSFLIKLRASFELLFWALASLWSNCIEDVAGGNRIPGITANGKRWTKSVDAISS